MESFEVTIQLIRNVSRIQQQLSYASGLVRIASKQTRMSYFIEDLKRIDPPTTNFEKAEGDIGANK
ncbi:2667_t:CDS:2 [Scutellospora calospora]|uniref:2667_t:CDS:1 n=1 Tax=Scutellospora calospora TaxID=85575 RepID=A0ACA9M0G5_9GLOM|nr:2667_t:CDS:2 [Scutellospora calospora]